MNQRISIWAAFAAMCMLGCGSSVLAQSQARDRDPATEQMLRAVLGPRGQAAFIGSQGFLDYEHPAEVSGQPLPALCTAAPVGEEPPEALYPYQSRGQRIEINWAVLDGLAGDAEPRVTLPLFDGEDLELVFRHSEYRSATRFSWFGQIAGVATSDFILVRHDDAVYMRVSDYEGRREHEIQFSAGRDGLGPSHVLRKSGDLRPQTKCGTCGSSEGAEPPSAPAPGSYEERATADPTDTVDVMIFCTVQALNSFGSNSSFYANAQACVDDANLRNSNSGTGLRLRLMYANPTDAAYWEDPSGDVDLSRLGNSTDGIMDNLLALRSSYRADLVALFRLTTWECDANGCTAGLGYRPSSMPAPNSAFTVNSISGSPLPRIFSHEIGHNLGACHDVGHGGCGQTTPGLTSSPHGYVRTCNTGFCTLRWDTTMAYETNTSCDSSTPIPYYSNPGIQFDPPGVCGPAPIGDGTANVTGLINFSRNSVSQYRIGSTQVWTQPNLFSPGIGTNFSPYSRVWMAVQNVRGGAAEGVVKVFAGTYEESTGGAAPRVLNGACVMQSADGGSAVLR